MKYRELSGFAGTRVRTADARSGETQVGASHFAAGSHWTCSDKIPKQHCIGGDSLGPGEKYRFGPFEVHTGARELSKGGTKIKLRGQPYLILEVLLSRAGEVVTREEIRAKLWPADTFVDFEHGLNTSVKKLRQVLCDSAEDPRYIETVPRLGYRFVAPVEVVTEAPKPSASARAIEAPVPALLIPPLAPIEPQPTPLSTPLSGQQASRWKLLRVSLGVLALLGLVFVGMVAKFPLRMHWPFGSSNATVNASLSAKQFGSLAVLPLENLSDDPAQEYFADGMTDELIGDLAQLRSLRVISRTSVMHYKGGKQTVPQIGRELAVDAVIEGTVEREKNRVRIRVQLIEAASDRHLWARTYDYELKDVLLLQSTAAHDIASEIQGRVEQPPASLRPNSARTVQPDAYEAYLKGRYFWNQRTEAGLNKSIEFFQDAIAKDPAFAAAYAGLAGSYSLLGSESLPPEIARAKARAAAGKALELDPASAEGHAELGLIEFYYDWNWQKAEQEFQRAIELNPSYATTHQWYSHYLRAMGRLPEALQQAQQAQQSDPLSLSINTTLAARYRDLSDFKQAVEVVQRTLELDPNFAPGHELLASVYEQQRDFQSDISELQKASALSKDNPTSLAHLGRAYALSGNPDEARKIAERLQRTARQHYVPAWDMAVLFAGMGDANTAFRWLEQSYAKRESQMPFLKVDYRMDPLRADPRFQNMLRRVRLPG
jgi:TolB-like protein/DNA-binding winged helix-turn-helix (wHTH) protein/Tfp pilus assembly protein PilF